MAFSYTLATLKDKVQEWLEDESDEFAAAFSNVVNLAELMLLKDLPLSIFDQIATGTLTTATLTKPSGWVETLNLFITVSGEQVLVLPKPWDYVKQYGGTGTPIYFAETDATTITVAPAPTSQAYTMRYVKRPTPLSETTGATTTWLSANTPDCMFWACILASEHYRKADDRIEAAKKFYQHAVETALRDHASLLRVRYGQ